MAEADDWVTGTTPGQPAQDAGVDDWVAGQEAGRLQKIGRSFGDVYRGAAAGSQAGGQQFMRDITAPIDTETYIPRNGGLRGELEAPFAPTIGVVGGLAARGAKLFTDVGGIVGGTLAGATAPAVVPAATKAGEAAGLPPEEAQERAETFNEQLGNIAFAAEGAIRGPHAPEVVPERFAPAEQKSVYTSPVPANPILSGEIGDASVTHSPIGQVLDAFGEGPRTNWGVKDIVAGLDTKTLPSDLVKELSQGQAEATKSFNEAFQRSAAAAGLVQAGPSITEQLAAARNMGVIGEGEAGWKGTIAPDDAATAARIEAGKLISTDAGPLIPPTIRDIARQNAPEVFGGEEGFDALQAHETELRGYLGELRDQRDQGFAANPPLASEIGSIQDKIDALLGKVGGVEDKLTKTKAAQLDDLRGQLDDLKDQSSDLARRDTDEMQRVRQAILANDYKMRDLAPQVSAAYREARAQLPPEPEPAPVEAQPVAEVTPEPQAPGPTPVAAEQPQEAPQPAIQTPSRPVPANVAADVSQMLQSAGRPAEEADAAGALIQAHYEARAARFGGALGTGPELYAREAPEVRAGRVTSAIHERAREYAQAKAQTESPQFKKWFGESAVKGEDGDPLVVYHGTGASFDEFSTAKLGSATGASSARHGFFFTENPEVASQYADLSDTHAQNRAWAKVEQLERLGKYDEANKLTEDLEGGKVDLGARPNVVPAYLKIENPLIHDFHGQAYDPQNSEHSLSAIIATAKKAGHDGVILRNLDDAPLGRVEPQDHYVVFDPKQIKSAVGNRGTFDPNDPRILNQAARGKIAFRDAKSTITLMKDANASTFIHETGHQWLEEIMRDAGHDLATDEIKTDAKTVRDYLGINEGEAISTRQHEKFARSFERYMMEGVAPSKGLAEVFAKFKSWLTQIYQTVAKLRAPINDDIRAVFDRLIAEPEERAVIAPDGEPEKSLADIHEVDAQHTAPEHADHVGDAVAGEVNRVAERKAPDIAPELANAGEAPELAETPVGGAEGAEPAGSGPGKDGDAAEPAKVGERGDNPPAEGAGARVDDTDTSLPDERVTRGTEPPRSESDLIDKAGNIRLDNLNLPEDVDDALRQIARENNDFNEARFGDEGKKLHDSILAARKLTAQAAQVVSEARVKAAAETATEQDLRAYQEASNRLAMIASRLATITHSWGYAGRAFRMLEGMPETGRATSMAELAARTKGMTLFQLKREAQLGMELETDAQRNDFLFDARLTKWQKAKSMIIELFVNNLISGPITHAAYTIGNQSMNIFKATAETAAQATISTLRGAEAGDRVYFGEIPAQFYGMINGAPDGWAAARKAWKTGIAEPLPGALEALTEKQRTAFEEREANKGAIPGRAGQIIRLPSDSVSAIHSFGSRIAYTQELYRLAYRDASDKGLTGQAHADAMARFLNDPPDEAITQARDEGTRMVLMKPSAPDSKFSKFKGIVNDSLPLKIIMPFMQVGANILHEGFLERTPLGLMDEKIRANLLGHNGVEAQTIQAGKIAAGTALSTAVIGLTLNGVVSGGGPSDPHERALKMTTGWQPYSIKMGDYWVPYRKFLGPLGTLIAGVSDVTEIAHSADDGDVAKAARASVFGLSEVIADESWFMGASNFVDAARNWDKPQAERYFRNLATSFIPFSVGLSQTARLIDPYQRQVSDIVDAARAKIPFLSQDLLPKRDVFGNPVPSRLMVSPTVVRPDPVVDQLEKIEKFIRTPDREIRGIKLTDQQYDDYSRISGRFIHSRLQGMFSSPGFSSAPDDAKRKLVDSVVAGSREQARNQIMMQSIGTQNDIVAKANAAKAGRH